MKAPTSIHHVAAGTIDAALISECEGLRGIVIATSDDSWVRETFVQLGGVPVREPVSAGTDELKRLMEAATPGPWEIDAVTVHPVDGPTQRYLYLTATGAGSGDIADLYHIQSGYHHKHNSAANAALIVAAVNALPELLALREENERLKAALTTISLVGGNMPDESFETKSGPCDAMMRGGMFVTCRALARAALSGGKP